MADRMPRDTQTREKTARYAYRPPNALPDPAPKDGWVYRWVRTATLGQEDAKNVSMQMNDGWEPVPATEVPEVNIQTDRHSRFKNNVEVGGLLLCRAPSERMQARTEYYQNMSEAQMEAVDNDYMREQDPRVPKLRSRQTRVQFGPRPSARRD